MKYTRIQRRSTEEFITIGEYIEDRQPRIWMRLHFPKLRAWAEMITARDVTTQILAAADISGRDKQYQYIMQERPHSGRGGLLPGEKEEDLYEKL